MKSIDTPKEDEERIKLVLKNHPDCVPVRLLHDTKSKLKVADKDL